MHRAIVAFLGVCLAVASFAGSAAHAASKVLRNDSFRITAPNEPVLCVLGYVYTPPNPKTCEVFEIFAATFTPDPNDYPYQITNVDVLACGGGAIGWALDTWTDTDPNTPAPTGHP